MTPPDRSLRPLEACKLRPYDKVPGGHRTHLGSSGVGGNGPGHCVDCGASWHDGMGALAHDLDTDSHAQFMGLSPTGRPTWLVTVPACPTCGANDGRGHRKRCKELK